MAAWVYQGHLALGVIRVTMFTMFRSRIRFRLRQYIECWNHRDGHYQDSGYFWPGSKGWGGKV